MEYEKIAKKTMDHLYQSYLSLHSSPLDSTIRVLVELRVSQINGCEYCCIVHTADAKKLGIAQEKIEQLPTWLTSDVFNDKERLALNLSETVTLSLDNAKAEIESLKTTFSEREIADLTICISLINALNRIAVSLRDE